MKVHIDELFKNIDRLDEKEFIDKYCKYPFEPFGIWACDKNNYKSCLKNAVLLKHYATNSNDNNVDLTVTVRDLKKKVSFPSSMNGTLYHYMKGYGYMTKKMLTKIHEVTGINFYDPEGSAELMEFKDKSLENKLGDATVVITHACNGNDKADIPSENSIDSEIRELINIINELPGLKTIGSCAGHQGNVFKNLYVNIGIDNRLHSHRGFSVLSAALSHDHEALPELSNQWKLEIKPGDWYGNSNLSNFYVELSFDFLNCASNKNDQIELLCGSIAKAFNAKGRKI